MLKTFRERKGKTAKLPLALSGMGGVGKTQTAVEYACRYRNEYEAVLWARAESQEVLISDFINFAEVLEITERDVKDQRIVIDAVKQWLNNHTNWVLVLDNVEDFEMISDFVPSEHKGHVLVTTQMQAMSGWAQRVMIEPMEPSEGALLLLRRANIITHNALLDEVSDADLTQAEAISGSLGGLPLGLDQAGAYIEETSLGLSGYLELYQTRQRELLQRRGKPTTGHPEPVMTTWSLSFAKVEQANVAAADLLRLCAFLYPDAIPEGIINKKIYDLSPGLHIIATDPLKLDEAIEGLLKFSLVRRDPYARTLTLHRLVQAALKEGMDKDTQRLWAERAVHAVSRAFPEVEFSTWLLCQHYLPHALRCRTLIEQWNMEFSEATALLYKAGYYLWDRSQYAVAEPFLERTLVIREKVLGQEHLDTVTSLSNLSIIYSAQAEQLDRQALAIREKLLGREHPDIAHSLDGLAFVLYKQGRYIQAKALAQRALSILERELGPKHHHVADALLTLALIFKAQHNYRKAESLLLRALAIREKALGQEHYLVANCLTNLGELYSREGKYEKAEPFYQRALTIYEKIFGAEHPHPQFARTLRDYAVILKQTKRTAKATELEAQARAIQAKYVQENKTDTESSS